MPRNVELKAKVCDVAAFRRRAEALSDTPVEILDQHDTFLAAPRGRLKLRALGPTAGELIHYERADRRGAKSSTYAIVSTEDPDGLRALLGKALGVRGVVIKRRFLYRIGRTRVHLDVVDRLGAFVELEVVLDDEQTVRQGRDTAHRVSEQLGIDPRDTVSGAYIDLLEETAP